MGEVIPWPKQDTEAVFRDSDVVLRNAAGKAVVTLTAEGRVLYADDLDEASEAFWRQVEDRIRDHWSDTTIPRLQAQVSLLSKTLDAEVPGWKERLRSRQSG